MLNGNPVSLDDVASSDVVVSLIRGADRSLDALGYTEHGLRHARIVAENARALLLRLGLPPRRAELAAIAGFMHDFGNAVNRHHHGHTSALLAYDILSKLGMPIEETVVVMAAVGNHEDDEYAVSDVAAALILADKADVHRTRVRLTDPHTFDEHDRVNFAVTQSTLTADPEEHTVTLALEIDTGISSIMDYFQIFIARMVQCRRAANVLGCSFRLVMNGVVLESGRTPPETEVDYLDQHLAR